MRFEIQPDLCPIRPRFAVVRIGGMFVAFLMAANWGALAQASCGDWLQHSDSQANAESRPALDLVPHRLPCRGPGCSQTPQREKPAPASPFKMVRTDRQWALSDVFISPELSAVGRRRFADDRAASVAQPRLERPPRG